MHQGIPYSTAFQYVLRRTIWSSRRLPGNRTEARTMLRLGTPANTASRTGRTGAAPHGRSQPPWALLASVLPATASLLTRMRAIDLAYHVKAGALTLQSGDLLRTDPFTFTRGGLPWVNQQWGAQLVFAGAHRLFGWFGVAMTMAAAVGAGFGFLFASCRRAGARPRTAAVLTLSALLVATGPPAPRPQALAVPLFTGTWLLLTRRDKWMWLVPILALGWANVHGSFVLAPLLVAFAFGEDLFDRKPAARTLLVLLATVAATFVTPFGPSVWSYAVEISRNETIRNWVAEWRAPTPLSLSGGPFWASGVIVLVTALWKRRNVRPIDIARLIVFFALGVPAIRGTLWWALAAPPVVSRWFRAPEGPDDGADRLDPLKVAASACIVALIPLALVLRAGIDPVTGTTQRLAADAPEVLVEATRATLPDGSRLLVYQPFASWFEYSLPEDPVMVDSRIELFPDGVWHDYDRAIAATESWRQILDEHRVDGVVLPPDAVLKDELAEAVDWRRVVDGPAGSVFVRS